MKKIIVVLLLLVIAVIFTAPYFTGVVAEKEIVKLLNHLNQKDFQNGTTEILEYERGFRQATARYEYSFPVWLNQKDASITYVCQSQHNIMSIDYQCALEKGSFYKKYTDLINVTGSVSIMGNLTQKITFDGLANLDTDRGTLDLPKAFLTLKTDASLSFYKLNLQSEPIEFLSTKGTRFLLKGLNIITDLSRLESLLFTGKVNAEFNLETVFKGSKETSLQWLSYHTDIIEDGDNLTSNILLSTNSTVTPNSTNIDKESLDLAMTIKNLDKHAMVEYAKFANNMQAAIFSSLITGDRTKLDRLAGTYGLYSQLIPVVEKILKENLELNINANAVLAGKQNNMTFDFKLLEPLTLAQLPSLVLDTESALQKFETGFTASLSHYLIENKPEIMKSIKQNPFFNETSEGYEIDLKIKDGIKLNNKLMSVEELKSMFITVNN